MASKTPRARPISPHLTIWKPGPHMVVSIVHRITGDGMATIGTVLLVWWLAALAGEKSYATFTFVFGEWMFGALGYLFGVGLTLSFFQHLASGIRHLVMDTGAGYAIKGNRAGALSTMVFSVLATAAFWAYMLMVK